MLIDTHCHLDFPEFDRDRDAVIRSAQENGIGYIVNIGSSLNGSRRSVELAKQYAGIYATVGIHPHEADSFRKEMRDTLRVLAKNPKVVAVGEIGLDYFKNYAQAENQRRLFISLLELAKELQLPVVIHNRQAQIDTLKIIRDFLPLKGVVHCFSGDSIFLEECLKLGFLVSFTANITYKKAQSLREIVKIAPLNKILLETDAPFLAPEGLRGRRNEPAYVKYVAEELSRIKEIGLEEAAGITTNNAKEFFKI